MSIRRQIVYDAVTQQMTGFVDLGDGCNDESEATEVLVFMLVGLTGHWKAPVACYLTRSLSAGVQTQLIRDLLVALHDINIRVWCITMDGHATNVRMCVNLGCQLTIGSGPAEQTKPFFNHPTSNTPVYILFDPSHMLKLARNLLQAYGNIRSSAGTISWSYIVLLHELQEKAGLRLANRLTSRHVNFGQQKMKVSSVIKLSINI